VTEAFSVVEFDVSKTCGYEHNIVKVTLYKCEGAEHEEMIQRKHCNIFVGEKDIPEGSKKLVQLDLHSGDTPAPTAAPSVGPCPFCNNDTTIHDVATD